MALIIPKNNADAQTLDATLKIYYDANDWVKNDVLIEKLSAALDNLGIENEKKEPQSYTKKTQVLAYFGFITWEDVTNSQSARRITELGKEFYEARLSEDTDKVIAVLIKSLQTCTFGRNVIGCDSDSDIEAPNVFIKASLLLGGLNNNEFAFILGKMEFDGIDFSDAIFNIKVNRLKNEKTYPSENAKKWNDPKPITALKKWGFFNSDDNTISDEVLLKYSDALINLRIKNTETIKFISKDDDEEGIKPLQQIFYGAPGTGKSNTIRREVDEKGKKNYRITFHPDSDYSTFVGAYKPSMKPADNSIYSAEELAIKLKEIKNTGVSYPCHKFAALYWRSLKDLSAEVIKQILSACGFTESMNVEISKGVAIGQEYLNKDNDGKIIYTFTPQAFTRAYVEAWNTEEEVYLIIEEINRGNCAQIFGDLFQLLDRDKNGFSEYPIDADTDLGNYIKEALKDSPRTDFRDGVKEGKKLVLPNNLFIWATMNTSDQSLFPIDSAFKRRWDWKYIPIKEGHEKRNIIAKGMKYDWWTFVDRMNSVVGEATSSEDKKMGFYFCKANEKKIDANTFVSKVVFYLWNDVFKDNGLDWLYDGNPVFKYKEKQSDGVEKDVEMAFASFFNADGLANEEQVVRLMKNLKIEGTPVNLDEEKQDNEDYNEEEDAKKDMTVMLNGETIHESSPSDTFVKVLQTIGFETFADKEIAKNVVVSRSEQDSRSWRKVNDYFVYTGWWANYKKNWLREMSKELGVDLSVE